MSKEWFSVALTQNQREPGHPLLKKVLVGFDLVSVVNIIAQSTSLSASLKQINARSDSYCEHIVTVAELN